MKLVIILLVLQFILLTSGVFKDEENLVTDDASGNSTNKDVKAYDELSLRKQISVFCPPCGIAVQKYDCCCLHRAGHLV